MKQLAVDIEILMLLLRHLIDGESDDSECFPLDDMKSVRIFRGIDFRVIVEYINYYHEIVTHTYVV